MLWSLSLPLFLSSRLGLLLVSLLLTATARKGWSDALASGAALQDKATSTGLGFKAWDLGYPGMFRDSWVMLYHECKFLKVTWKNSVVPKVLVPIDSNFEAVVGLCSPLEHPLPHKHILRHTINMVYVVESASESVSRSTP